MDTDTGEVKEALKGQVLVVSTVADAAGLQRHSCVIGYVDAKANKNANVLARQVADGVGRTFRCGRDRPIYYGNRGPLSGTPNDLAK